MNTGEIINELEDLILHCEEMRKNSENDIWERDCEALKYAVETIRKTSADGCSGCAFENVEEWEMPCMKCKRNCKDYWRKGANRYE